MITYEDVKFYKSQKTDFYDADNNGGMMSDTEITSGEINNIFDETTATQRENGIVKRAKVYVKNLTTDRVMSNSYIAVSKDADYPDTVKLYYAPKLDHYTFEFTQDVDAGTAAGTHISFDNATPDGVDVNNFVDRMFKVGNQILTVDGVDADNKEIWFKEDTSEAISSGDVAETYDDENTYESDVDWSSAKPYINTPILVTVSQGDTSVQIGASVAENFAAGDPIIIVDIYRRPMYRGKIDSIEDGDTDTLKKINLSSSYLGSTLPANQGFLASALNADIGPGEHFGFWIELTIGASNALNAEEIGSYQLEITFDDISAG